LRVVGAAALGAAALAAPARAQRVEYTGTLHVATGTYIFTERTTSVALFNGLSLAAGRLRLTATLPLLYQNSSAVTYIGGTPVPTGGPDGEAVRQRKPGTRLPMGGGGKGRATVSAFRAAVESDTTEIQDGVAEPGDFQVFVGDPMAEVDLDLHQGFGFIRSFTVNAFAKAPLADVDAGIGTGEWDYGLGAMLGVGKGRTYVFANATYWILGDMPALPLRNVINYGASVGRTLDSGGRWSLLGSFTGATTMFDGTGPPVSAGIGLGYLGDNGQGINLGVSVGLSESSPDATSYLGWRIPLGGRRK
jgi:hypothetical protein